MAEPADINVDELRRRARRRLVGAVVLALGVAVVVPMLLETEQKPLGEDVSVKIPPVDDGKFVNRLNDPSAAPAAPAADVATPATDATNAASTTAASETPSPRSQKYDTRVPDAAAGASRSSEGTAPSSATAPSSSAPAAAAPETSAPVHHVPTQPPSGGAKSAEPVAHDASDAAKASRAAQSVARAPEAMKPVQESAAPREGYAVQLAAFADDHGANSLAGRLKKAGYAAYTEPLKTSKGTLWRVRVGPYSSREAALAARDKLKTEGQIGIVAAIK
jgi:DedD protein